MIGRMGRWLASLAGRCHVGFSNWPCHVSSPSSSSSSSSQQRRRRRLSCGQQLLLLRSTTSFRRLHVTYFLFLSGAGAVALWLWAPVDGDSRLPFVDSLFTAVSALSVTGLGTVPMHRLSIPAQVLLLLLMILGSQVFTSAIPLFIRGAVSTRSISRFSLPLPPPNPNPNPSPSSAPLLLLFSSFPSLHLQWKNSSHQTSAASSQKRSSAPFGSSFGGGGGGHHASLSPVPLLMMEAAGACADLENSRGEREQPQELVDSPLPPPPHAKVVRKAASMPILPSLKWFQRIQSAAQPTNHNLPWHSSADATTDPLSAAAAAPDQPNRNNISKVGREPPVRGLIEQEALVILGWAVSMYFIAMQALGFLVCLATVLGSGRATRILGERNVNRAFFAVFSTVSAFANAGFALLDDNLVPMQQESAFLLWMCVLILMGNTLFAPAMRGVVWVFYKLEGGAPADDEINPGDIKTKKKLRRRAALHYLLTSPRRCFTHLFPRAETLWLLFSVALLSTIQLVAICGLDWHGPVFAGLTSNGDKLVNALFSSITTRNAGLNVANVAAFSPPTLFLLLVMMYIAVYPVYLSRERSKEQVDGRIINSKEVMANSQEGMMTTSKKKMIRIFRVLLARDSLYLVIATFWICVTERNSIRDDPLNFSIFNILFEIISAYGNVGLSFGYSCALQLSSSKDTCVDVPFSFSGKWSATGKVILTCVMLLGRHRGLPDDLDWAISLPSYS